MAEACEASATHATALGYSRTIEGDARMAWAVSRWIVCLQRERPPPRILAHERGMQKPDCPRVLADPPQGSARPGRAAKRSRTHSAWQSPYPVVLLFCSLWGDVDPTPRVLHPTNDSR